MPNVGVPGDLHWEGGGESAEDYQARWNQPAPRVRSDRVEFEDVREVDVDGVMVKFRPNPPFPSMIVTRDGDMRVVPTGGKTRFSNQELRKVAREVFRV